MARKETRRRPSGRTTGVQSFTILSQSSWRSCRFARRAFCHSLQLATLAREVMSGLWADMPFQPFPKLGVVATQEATDADSHDQGHEVLAEHVGDLPVD